MNSLPTLSAFARRLPMIHQSTVAECGLACVAMVAGYHGLHIDLFILRSRFAPSLRGMTFHDIYRTASMLNLSARGVKVKRGALNRLALPAILHWDDNHFVVLKKVTRKYVIVHDPAAGVRRYNIDEIDEHFQGYALEFTVTPEFVPGMEKSKANVSKLFKNLAGFRRALCQVALLALALEVFANLGPLYTQWVIDEVLVSADRGLLEILLIGYLMAMVLQAGTSMVRSWIFLRFGTQLNAILQIRVFSHLLRLPVSYFESRESGDIISRFYSLGAIQQTLTNSTVEAVVDGVMAVVVAIIIFTYSPSLSLVAVGFLVLYGLLRWVRYVPFRDATQDQIVSSAKLQTHFLETIRGARGIKLFDKVSIRTSQWMKLLYTNSNNQLKIGYLGINYGELGGFLAAIERGIIVYLGARAVLAGEMSIGYMLAFISYKDQFVARGDRLIQKTVDLFLVRLQADRLMDILATEAEKDSELPYLRSSEIEASVTFHNIGFRYSTQDQWVFRNINIKVEPGENVCITGRSGIGKSTLIKLMVGLATPEEGTISIGGIPIEQLGKQARALVACVMQDDQLYSGTILENISFFDLNPDIVWAEECARVAELHDDICLMKMGYNAIVGDMGSALSGGQRQRLMLARALYMRPRILILDESTSDLDVALERKIAANVSALDITRISIAHRPGTIQAADRVIDLNVMLGEAKP